MSGLESNWTRIAHDLAIHKLGVMRDQGTDNLRYRHLMRQLGLILCSEMMRDLPMGIVEVQSEHGAIKVQRYAQDRIALMPILRAGLPLGDAFFELMPEARVGHIGIYRTKANEHHCYMLSLPPAERDLVILLDPVVTLGNTQITAIGELVAAKVPADQIRLGCLVGSHEGFTKIHEAHPEVKIYTFCDEDEVAGINSFLRPGLGNVSGKLFHTGE